MDADGCGLTPMDVAFLHFRLEKRYDPSHHERTSHVVPSDSRGRFPHMPDRRPAAKEIPAKGKITAVDLFKNGLAVVTCEVALGKPGVYVLDEVPQPVHGTYSIESPAGWSPWSRCAMSTFPSPTSNPATCKTTSRARRSLSISRGTSGPPSSAR